MTYLGGGALEDERMLSFVDRSPEALRFFAACGVGFRIVRGITDHYYGKAPGGHDGGRSIEVELISGEELGAWRDRILVPHEPCFVTAEEQVSWGGINRFSQWDQALVAERKRRDMRGKGLALICHFIKALAARGVPIRTEQQVARLLVESDRVTGVVLENGDTIAADKGVVLATGGYYANPEMAARLEGIPGLEQEASSLAPPSMTGQGLVFGAEIGGIIHKVENSLRIQLAYTIPADEPGALPVCVHAGIVELCSPHTLVVNRAGRRFADESFFQGIVPHLRMFDAMRHEYPNIPAFLVFDAQYLAEIFLRQPAGRQRGAGNRAARRQHRPSSPSSSASMATRWRSPSTASMASRRPASMRISIAAKINGSSRRRRRRPATRCLGTVAEPPFFGVKLHPTNPNSAGLLDRQRRAGPASAAPCDPRPVRDRRRCRAHRVGCRLPGRPVARRRHDLQLSGGAAHGGKAIATGGSDGKAAGLPHARRRRGAVVRRAGCGATRRGVLQGPDHADADRLRSRHR